MPYTYEHPRPSVTVDCVVFGLDADELKILLIQRHGEPFKGKWALPGGFVQMEEDLETAARRELHEETSVRDLFLEQLYTFGDVAVVREQNRFVVAVLDGFGLGERGVDV